MSIPENPMVEVASKENEQNETASREIFFIDDDEEELDFFDQALKELTIPFKLHYAKNGNELFTLLDQSTPDLIFLDIHMPGKSGITCLKMLRHNKKYDSTPIIIYSRLSNQRFIDDCFEAKANYYLIKPVSVTKLTVAINRVIETNWNSEKNQERENFVIQEE